MEAIDGGSMSKPVARKSRKTAFVPRGIFVSALASASVIPLCACGGSVTSGGGRDAGGSDTMLYADVARQGFDAGADRLVATVAYCCFDGAFGVAADAFGVADAAFGVALDAFGGSDSPIQGVAVQAFDASDTGLIHGVPPVAFDGKR
jgi:hypothetical protein